AACSSDIANLIYRHDWFASLRTSSGQTPVGLTSKGASTSSDTGPMSSAELAEAARHKSTRHRAEEVMAAPAPDTDQHAKETPAARRLRGRAQGLRVARELDERRSRHARALAAEEDTEHAQATERQHPTQGERATERAPAQPPRTRARGQGLPAPAPQEDTTSPSTEPRRKKRPHAAPWELDRPDAGGGGTYPDVSDYAARYAAASGRSVTDAPWSPPAPEPSAEEGATDHHTGREDDHDPHDHEQAQETTATPPTEQATDRQYTPDQAPAVPELDHGTGEHEAM